MTDIEADTESSTGSTIEVGGVFGSFYALEEAIGRFQKDNSVQFFIRDSRKIEAAKRRSPHRKFNENLVYSKIVYCCIHGGKTLNVAAKESDLTNSKLPVSNVPYYQC